MSDAALGPTPRSRRAACPAALSESGPDGGAEFPAEFRWKALRALGRFGARAVPALIEALGEDGSPDVRCFAADVLGRMGPDAHDAVPELVRVFRHDVDPVVRRAAAGALAAIEPSRLG